MRITLALTIILLLKYTPVAASLITYQFSGKIDNVDGSVYESTLSLGKTFTGRFTVDTSYFTPGGYAYSAYYSVGALPILGLVDCQISFPNSWFSSLNFIATWGISRDTPIFSFMAIDDALSGSFVIDSQSFNFNMFQTHSNHTVWSGTTEKFQEIPEPSSILLLLAGLLGIIRFRCSKIEHRNCNSRSQPRRIHFSYFGW